MTGAQTDAGAHWRLRSGRLPHLTQPSSRLVITARCKTIDRGGPPRARVPCLAACLTWQVSAPVYTSLRGRRDTTSSCCRRIIWVFYAPERYFRASEAIHKQDLYVNDIQSSRMHTSMGEPATALMEISYGLVILLCYRPNCILPPRRTRSSLPSIELHS